MLLLSVSHSIAQDSVVLEKNSPAPFTGILIKPETAQELKKAYVERDGLLGINQSLERSVGYYKTINDAQATKVDILLKQNDKLAERLGDERSMGTWERIGWVALGVAAAWTAAYGFKQTR